MAIDPLFERVRETVQHFKLLRGGERVLVAFSGGPDSVFLLLCLLRLRDQHSLRLALAHFHHGLREEEADLDLEFSRERAKELEVPFFWERKNLRDELKGKEGGIETLARHHRLDFLRRSLRNWGGDLIATGHTLTDSVETSFFNLMRGTGLSGLAGIPPKRGVWIRPLIEVTREEIREYLKTEGIQSREDRTNLEPATPRNFLRLKVFPLLEARFPHYQRRWSRTLTLLREAHQIVALELRKEIERLKRPSMKDMILLDRYIFQRLPLSIRRGIVFYLCGGSFSEAEEILKVIQRGGERMLKTGDRLQASFRDILVTKSLPSLGEERELKMGDNLLEDLNMVVTLGKGQRRREGRWKVMFPLAEISSPIKVRKKREGDRIVFDDREKKLKEIFMENEIPRWRRELVPIIEDRKGILWVPGFVRAVRKPIRPPYLIISVRRLSDERFWIYDI